MIGSTLIDEPEDNSSFEKLYLKNRQIAYGIAFRILQNESLAEDACSECFLAIAKAFGRIRKLKPEQQQYYIAVTARNMALNLLRKEKKYLETISYSDEVQIPGTEENTYEILHTCISKLSHPEQEILYLHINMELRFKECGQALGISAHAARQRFWAAKSKLKKLLEQEGYHG